MNFDYTAWLTKAEDRLSLLKRQRADLDAEITTLENGIKAFAPLVEEKVFSQGVIGEGLTDIIRRMFADNPTTAFAPTGIRDDLLSRGIILGQTNPLAVIHQILARLKAKDLIEPIEYQGKTYYRRKDSLSPTARKIVDSFMVSTATPAEKTAASRKK